MNWSSLKPKTRNQKYAWLIGTGFMLFAVHNPNQPLLNYAFLPWIGLLISVMGLMFLITENRKNLDFGSKKIWIPLVVIVASMGISGIWQMAESGLDPKEAFAPLLFGVYLFGGYLAGRILGRDLFAPFAVAVIIEAVSCVVYGLINPGHHTGGIIGPMNYDMAAGFLIFGTLVSALRHQWWLTSVALIGLFFTGAPEAMLGVGILFIVILIRRDFNKKILLPIGLTAVILAGWFATGYGGQLYAYAKWAAVTVFTEAEHPVTASVKEAPIAGRIRLMQESLEDIKPFGHGYYITEFTNETVHNIPLLINWQVGILAAIAWLWVTLFCLVKTKWKYVFTAVLVLGLFDHYLWTQVAPWWWGMVGVATVDTGKDLIFKAS